MSIFHKNNFSFYTHKVYPYIIEIEGTDGSGKETQANLLKHFLEIRGMNVLRISFPRYDNESSGFVKKYLSGEYGSDPESVDACKASMLFAFDRMIASMDVNLDDYDFVIFDRYTGSNMIHQSCKLIGDDTKLTRKNKKKIKRFCNCISKIEYDWVGIPKADMVIFLDMPLWSSTKLRADRENKINGSNVQDIHESNREYLKKVEMVSKYICKTRKWINIPCTSGTTIRSIDDISDEIRRIFRKENG